MAIRYEKAEIQRSLQRGAGDVWPVQDAERSGDWILFEFDERRVYAPLEHRELPHQFARCATNEDALLTFVKDNGRLGWRDLTAASNDEADLWLQHQKWQIAQLGPAFGKRQLYAEPVEWIRAHAATVKWCLEAAHTLGISNGRIRNRHCVELLYDLFPDPVGKRGTIEHISTTRMLPNKIPLRIALAGMVRVLLEPNLSGVRRRLQIDRNGQLQSVWAGSSLIESIYTLIADAITSGRLAQCEHCGAGFIQTDSRQRYCPPPEGKDKSDCMNRERVRRQRPKAKGHGNGKPTRKG
jgi:hypothetical protein